MGERKRAMHTSDAFELRDSSRKIQTFKKFGILFMANSFTLILTLFLRFGPDFSLSSDPELEPLSRLRPEAEDASDLSLVMTLAGMLVLDVDCDWER